MSLAPDELEVFYRLHRSLMFYVNRRLRLIDQDADSPEAYARLPPELRIEVHKALPEHLELINAFVDENPFHFDDSELEIVRSWRYLVAGTFYAFRQLRNYMVFLTSTEPVAAYGVLPLFDPFEVVIGPYLPRMIRTTLLPFRGRIVYDGLISGYNITFGAGLRRRFNESYRKAKERSGIITTLPPTLGTAGPTATRTSVKKRAAGARTARARSGAASSAQAAHDRIVALTDAFCRAHLDAGYEALCRKLAGVLARKRPSPLTRGKPESWASGIVRVIGWVNFLGDPSQPHHMIMTDIDRGFGVSEATGAAKSMAIRNLLRIRRFDPEWTVPSMVEKNPLIWMIQVNGLMADARQLPREIQEQAFRKGLIPYIPADRAGESSDE